MANSATSRHISNSCRGATRASAKTRREHVFLDGQADFSGPLVERFASYHRQSYGGCKVGVGDVLIGAAVLIARMNGVEKASHIRDKIVEMVHLNETLYACGLACSQEGQPTPAGNWQVDQLLANVCKLNVTRLPYEIARLATDIAGGLLGTLPAEAEMENEQTGAYLRKYLAGAGGCPPGTGLKFCASSKAGLQGPVRWAT